MSTLLPTLPGEPPDDTLELCASMSLIDGG
jgi:hypothetical protein